MSSQYTIEKAIELRNQGKKQEARNILLEIVAFEPGNIPAWFWLVDLAPNDEQRLSLLQRCVRQNPANAKAIKALEWMQTKISAANERKSPVVAPAETVKPAPTKPNNASPSSPPARESLFDNLPDDPPPLTSSNQMVRSVSGPKPIKVVQTDQNNLKPNLTPAVVTAPNVSFSFQWLGIAITLLSLFLIFIILIFGWLFRDLVSPVLQIPTPTFLPSDQSNLLIGLAVLIHPWRAGYQNDG